MATDPAGLEQAATQTPRENQLRFVINVGLRRWRLILGLALIGAVAYGLFGMYTFEIQPEFVGTATLRVQQSPWEKGVLRDVGGEPLFRTSPQALVERVSLHGAAEDVTRALIQQDVERGLPYGNLFTEEEFTQKVREIESRLRIEPVAESGIIRISCTAGDLEEAKRLAEIAARVFIDRNRQFLLEEEEETHEFVVRKVDELRQTLDAADSELWKYRKEMDFRTKDDVTAEMQKLSREVISAEATQEETRAKMASIESQLIAKKAQLPMSISQVSESVIRKQLDDLTALHSERASLAVIWQPHQGPLEEIEAEILDKEQAILQTMQELDPGGSGVNVLEDIQGLREQHLSLQLQMTSLDITSATNRKIIMGLEGLLPELSAKDKEYQRLVRETTQLRNQLDALLNKEFALATDLRREQGSIERQGAALASEIPASQRIKPWMNFIIGGLVGLGFGLGLAMLFEMSDTSIRTIEDITDYIGLEVIGTIPEMRFGKARGRFRGNYVRMTEASQVDSCIVTQHDPKSPISEAYRTLRTTFQLATLQLKPKSIMVTSSVPAEGKTTTAVNMAVTFADSGLRVIIIDTDLRRPHVHHVLRMERGPGLADVLREGCDVHTVIRPTRVENLWMISSGRVPPNPSELIGSDRMRNLMAQLEGEFDLVICDAPSLLVVTDPVLLSTEVDSVVLVVSAKWARRETVQRGKKLLETARANLIGVVLNGLEATRRHYYYYYYYYDDTSSRSRKRWYNV